MKMCIVQSEDCFLEDSKMEYVVILTKESLWEAENTWTRFWSLAKENSKLLHLFENVNLAQSERRFRGQAVK